jgi:hypothetical protein
MSPILIFNLFLIQECIQPWSVSCSTSSVRSSLNDFAAVSYYTSGKKEKKEKPYKVLMMLIVVMYVNQSILLSIDCYLSWLAYIKYGGSHEAVAVFYQTKDTPVRVLYLLAVIELLETIRLGIADSIMVSLFYLEL